MPLHYFLSEECHGQKAWWAALSLKVSKNWTRRKQLSTPTCTPEKADDRQFLLSFGEVCHTKHFGERARRLIL